MNFFDLTGTVSIVSGGGGWLGREITSALALNGSRVTVVGRDRVSTEKSLENIAAQIDVMSADVRDQSWPDAINRVIGRAGRLDILVNNAHISRGGSLRTARSADYRDAYELAVIAAATGIDAARVALTESARAGGPASIINVASMYGVVAPDPANYSSEESRNPPFYGAAKAGLVQLTRYAAAELGPAGVRVNAIAPGPFPGPAAQADQEFTARLARHTMLGRIGRPQEIAATAVYLASHASSYVTGAVIPVDGGWTAW